MQRKYQKNPDEYYTTTNSFIVVLDSRNATHYYNGSNNSRVRFDFEQSLNFDPKAIKNTCSVLQFNAPNSLYNINETNNVLNMTLYGSVASSLVVPYGNYNAVSFATYFNTQLASKGFSITFNSTTNCFTITNTTYSFTINPSSTIYNVMGFAQNTTYSGSAGVALVLPFTCNFNGFLSFKIHFDNLGTRNMDSYNASSGTVIQSIPVDPTNNIISFIRQFDFNFRVYPTVIDYIEISLQDDLENLLNFNNQNWNLVLCFTSYTDLDRFHYEQNFHSVLNEAYVNNLDE